jgi:hypothetical protein
MYDVSSLHHSSIDIPCSIFSASGRGIARKGAEERKAAKDMLDARIPLFLPALT